MNVDDPRFEQYEERFRALAEEAEHIKGAASAIASARHHLCLYGENGLSPEEEFSLLETLREQAGKSLKVAEVQTYYWEDLVLFVPDEA